MTLARIGTAGWSIPRTCAARFPTGGSALERYSAIFDAGEINTTFYRPHMASTFERWRAATPAGFRFAVKLARAVTHDARLQPTDAVLEAGVGQALMLGDKLGPLLVQLPPSLIFDPVVAEAFLTRLRRLFGGRVACEPRHPSWFEPEPEALLAAHEVARVAADPARHPDAGRPGGWPALAYWRLHGSPRIYYSAYGEAFLDRLADTIAASAADETWCIFDNTTSGAATSDALGLQARVVRT